MRSGLASRPGDSPRSGPRSGNPPRVLVVDDHEAFRDLICHLLRSAGYEVAAAATRSEALTLAAPGEQLDLVLMDVRLREESGIRAAREIQMSRPGLPVVYMSGHPRHVAMVAADDPFLEKPFSPDELLALVATGLELRPGNRSER